MARHAFQLRLHRLAHLRVQALAVTHQGLHGRLDHRAQCVCRRTGGATQAFAERALHRIHQPLEAFTHFLLEYGLSIQQALGEPLAALVDAFDQRLQLAPHLGQHLALLLQRIEHRLALVRSRKRPQGTGDAGIERARAALALAPCPGQHQPQQCRRGHTRHRSAEGKAQPPDRRGQRGTDGLQVGRALEREDRALEGHHHAQEGAQHAQHDQQAHQIGGHRHARQGHALAGQALAHRRAKPLGHPADPGLQVLHRIGQDRQRAIQTGGRGAEATHFQRTGDEHDGDQRRHAQRDRAGADETGTGPGHGNQAEDEGNGIGKLVHERFYGKSREGAPA